MLILHRCGIFDVNGLESAIQVNDNSDRYGYFRGSHHNDEHGEKDPFELMRIKVLVERYKIDIDTIKYKLHRHQHGDEVTAREEPVNA
jgi:hypothetical protein